jgi:hypothetical protein
VLSTTVTLVRDHPLKADEIAIGDVSRYYKARLVCKVLMSRDGIDHLEIFALIARFSSIQLLITIAALSAFLTKMSRECTYILHLSPIRLKRNKEPKNTTQLSLDCSKCCIVSKRFKTMERCCQYFRNRPKLTRCDANARFYVKREGRTDFSIITLYVDDRILTSNSTELLTDVKSQLKERHKINE